MEESNQNSIHLKEVEKEGFLYILQEIYSEDVVLSPSNIESVYTMAHKFGERNLQLKCEKFLEDGMDIDNVCDIFRLSDIYFASHLRKSALNFILIQYDFIHYRKEFLELPKELRDEVREIIDFNTSFKTK